MKVSPGSTDVTTYYMLRLSADGTAATGLTATNFDLQYTRSGAAAAAKVDATLNTNGVGGAHLDNTVIEVDATSSPGLYRVDWPDAAFASGVAEVICTVKVATAFTEPLRVELQVNSIGSGAAINTTAELSQIQVNESIPARRRVYFDLRDATDGTTPEAGEAGGQPQRTDPDGVVAGFSLTPSGPVSPDITTNPWTTDLTKTNDGEAVYTDGTYFCWYDSGTAWWYITVEGAIGSVPTDHFQANSSIVTGDGFSGQGSYTGTTNAASSITYGPAWTSSGIGLLVYIGEGLYYSDLSQGAVDTVGDTIRTTYTSAAVVEASPGTSVQVVVYDPWANESDLTRIHGSALTETATQLAGAFSKFFDVASPTGTANSLPDALPDAAGGLPISDAGGLDLDTLLGTLTSLAAETRSANLLDQIKTVIAVIESQRDAHTHQPSTGVILFIDPTNGATTGSGATGGISDPISTRQDAHDTYGTDFGHDLYILVSGVSDETSLYAEDMTVSKGYSLFRGPGRDLTLTPTANNTVAFTVTADGCELSGFQIDDFNGTGAQHGIQATDVDFLHVHNVWVNQTTGDGANLLRCTNCLICDCNFDGTGTAANGQGVHVVGTGPGIANDNVICRNHFSNTGGDSILIENGTTNDTSIFGNTIHNSVGWAINIGGSSVDALVYNNEFGNNASGNILDGGTTSVILNNYDVVDGVWDELLTGATHNIASSAGRRLRDITSPVTHTGTVVSATANTVTLDAAAQTADGSYDPSQIITTAGTGSGQVRGILEYFGTGANGNPDKTAILDRDWKTALDATTEFTIIAQDGRMSTNEGQLRAATSTVLQLNSLAPGAGEADLSGQIIQLLSGTGQDQVRLILSYNGATQEVTVKALDVTPNATTGYQVLPFGMVSLEAIQNDAQSVADLKNFADAGYDPVTNKVQGVVLVDGLSTAALAQFITDDTGETSAADGSVAKISQGAAGGNVTVGDLTQAALAQFATDDTGETSASTGSVAQLSQGSGSSIVLQTTTLEAAPTLAIELDQNYAWSKEITAEDSQTGKEHVFAVYKRNDLDTVLWELDTTHITVSGDEGKTLTIADDDANTGDDGDFYYELANTTDDVLVTAGPLTIIPRGDTEA